MTPDQTGLYNTAIREVYDALQALPVPGTVPDTELYEPLQRLQDLAGKPWDILLQALHESRPVYYCTPIPVKSVSTTEDFLL